MPEWIGPPQPPNPLAGCVPIHSSCEANLANSHTLVGQWLQKIIPNAGPGTVPNGPEVNAIGKALGRSRAIRPRVDQSLIDPNQRLNRVLVKLKVIRQSRDRLVGGLHNVGV